MKTLFKHSELPIDDFQRLGLVSNGEIALEPHNISALIFGRRTGLVSLENLEANGFKIEKIDLKLSLQKNEDGSSSLMLHPIYKRPQQHMLLQDYEADSLLDTSISAIAKVYTNDERKTVQAIIEYDFETRSYVAYDPLQIESPVNINGMELTEKQQTDFRRGALIELSDGTKLRHRASEALGLQANRHALIFSYEKAMPGKHVLIRDIPNFHTSHDRQLHYATPAFQAALKDFNPSNYAAIATGNERDEYRDSYMKR